MAGFRSVFSSPVPSQEGVSSSDLVTSPRSVKPMWLDGANDEYEDVGHSDGDDSGNVSRPTGNTGVNANYNGQGDVQSAPQAERLAMQNLPANTPLSEGRGNNQPTEAAAAAAAGGNSSNSAAPSNKRGRPKNPENALNEQPKVKLGPLDKLIRAQATTGRAKGKTSASLATTSASTSEDKNDDESLSDTKVNTDDLAVVPQPKRRKTNPKSQSQQPAENAEPQESTQRKLKGKSKVDHASEASQQPQAVESLNSTRPRQTFSTIPLPPQPVKRKPEDKAFVYWMQLRLQSIQRKHDRSEEEKRRQRRTKAGYRENGSEAYRTRVAGQLKGRDAAAGTNERDGRSPPWMSKSFHDVWSEDEDLPPTLALAEAINQDKPLGLLRVTAYVHTLFKEMKNADLTERAAEFFKNFEPSDIITNFNEAAVDSFKSALNERDVHWDVIKRAGRILSPDERQKQGIYAVRVESDEVNSLYVGSACGAEGFKGRLFDNHLCESYRARSSRTPLYRAIANAGEHRTNYSALVVLDEGYAASDKFGLFHVKMYESICLAMTASYDSSQHWRIKNEVQYVFSWPPAAPSAREDWDAWNESRGFKGHNRSLPYAEDTLAEVPFPFYNMLEDGLKLVVDFTSKDGFGRLILGPRAAILNLTDEQTRLLKDSGISSVTLKGEIEADGKVHEHQWTQLPSDQNNEQWEEARSLALNVSFLQRQLDGTMQPHIMWLKHFQVPGREGIGMRSTKLGLAKWAMSLIEHMKFTQQVPAGPTRVNFERGRNTKEPKVWDKQTDNIVVLEAAKKLAIEIINNARPATYTCTACGENKAFQNPNHNERVEAVKQHILTKVECKRYLLTHRLQYNEADVEENLRQCPHCETFFADNKSLKEHLIQTDSCREAENEMRQSAGEDPIQDQLECRWCGNTFVYNSHLTRHWNSPSGAQCKVKENADRRERGVEELPNAFVCGGCQKSHASASKLSEHLFTISSMTCLQTENRLRSEAGEDTCGPPLYFCHEPGCKKPHCDLPVVVAKHDAIKQHYKKFHTTVVYPGKEVSEVMPTRFGDVMPRYGFDRRDFD